MIDDQRFRIPHLSRCRFMPGGFDKRFVRDMAARMALDPDYELTPKQAAQLDRLWWNYRRQTGAEYGFCPRCGAKCRTRQRGLGGDDVCYNGHRYPSRTAVHAAVKPGDDPITLPSSPPRSAAPAPSSPGGR